MTRVTHESTSSRKDVRKTLAFTRRFRGRGYPRQHHVPNREGISRHRPPVPTFAPRVISENGQKLRTTKIRLSALTRERLGRRIATPQGHVGTKIIMSATQHVTLAASLTACEVFNCCGADKYPCTGNEDVPVAIGMTRDALEKARVAVLSPDDPPESRGGLRELQRRTSRATNRKRSSGRSTTISNRRTDND